MLFIFVYQGNVWKTEDKSLKPEGQNKATGRRAEDSAKRERRTANQARPNSGLNCDKNIINDLFHSKHH